MKIRNHIVCIFLIIIVIAASCAIRKSEPVNGRNFTSIDSRVLHGEHLYMSNCQKCHPAAESGLGPALNSSPAPGFLKRFQMRHGLGVMPSFTKNELSKSDLHDIARYLHAWKNY